jgi:hypothetical protein
MLPVTPEPTSHQNPGSVFWLISIHPVARTPPSSKAIANASS